VLTARARFLALRRRERIVENAPPASQQRPHTICAPLALAVSANASVNADTPPGPVAKGSVVRVLFEPPR